MPYFFLLNSKETFEVPVYHGKSTLCTIKVNGKETFEVPVYSNKEFSLYYFLPTKRIRR